jgi:uncharacterized membrane protein
MKSAIAIVTILALMTVSGCWFGGTKESAQGGIVPQDEGFSITVPKSNTVKQGADIAVTVSLNRGAYFKQDVDLDIKTDGISVTPTSVLIKASDKPDVKLQIAVSRDAAIGEYRVTVKGTPKTGEPASTEFTVKVVAQ